MLGLACPVLSKSGYTWIQISSFFWKIRVSPPWAWSLHTRLGKHGQKACVHRGLPCSLLVSLPLLASAAFVSLGSRLECDQLQRSPSWVKCWHLIFQGEAVGMASGRLSSPSRPPLSPFLSSGSVPPSPCPPCPGCPSVLAYSSSNWGPSSF